MAVRQPSKLVTWVRFPSPAPTFAGRRRLGLDPAAARVSVDLDRLRAKRSALPDDVVVAARNAAVGPGVEVEESRHYRRAAVEWRAGRIRRHRHREGGAGPVALHHQL